ncbi:hypothetical protein [Vibrio palustris]|nr:hypothetical protein [Vibrio palustris]
MDKMIILMMQQWPKLSALTHNKGRTAAMSSDDRFGREPYMSKAAAWM